MLKLVSIICALIIFITGCGTNIESIDYFYGDDTTTNFRATFSVREVGDDMQFELSLTNEGNEKALIQFPSGQQFEIIVKDEENQVVYRFSEGRMFTMAIVMKEIEPGETLVWVDEWKEAKQGMYTVIGELQIMSINNETVDRNQFRIDKKVSYEK
ncbi:BsuPI-related putative proteinase inhibitor [Anaerobacillus isosaccharinicus]|uniref:Intracellular proteinase inhibitor BsuPI domain-containing protein n=1 Tax=Anaerobacillus isosaccharinicus TaxID=1532552 RepID=A0A7S7L469_9BACI|nr:BsuPI-related putative proteinase inhibitor [Anaerobacillus isosaccharinicus]MBA5587724.1 hypothetical protein [Anaerobacillus isosaccharinicus]QOY34111.1 hypothetical protein AWH56_015350 [Anaerobacillus isosaccharinicus]